MEHLITKRMAAVAALLCALTTARSQPALEAGLYHIDSGSFVQKGGLVSETITPLPTDRQAYVELFLDTNAGNAGLTFLGLDLQPGFTSLTNGVITNNMIRFQYVITNAAESPLPVPAYLDYIVTNDLQSIWISGSITSSVACCDMPYAVEHRLVRAFSASIPLTIRFSEVEVCWDSETNNRYQVQYKSELTTNLWVNLGSPIAGDPGRTCATDKIIPAQPQRFYRVLAAP